MNITVFDIYLEIYYDFQRFKKQIIHFFGINWNEIGKFIYSKVLFFFFLNENLC